LIVEAGHRGVKCCALVRGGWRASGAPPGEIAVAHGREFFEEALEVAAGVHEGIVTAVSGMCKRLGRCGPKVARKPCT
jgi:hypothetical protein